MKLDRNLPHGRGKYALLKVREIYKLSGTDDVLPTGIAAAIKTLDDAGYIEWGTVGTPGEFFAIMLKDRYADSALDAYATAALDDEQYEYSDDVMAMAMRAGENSPWCKTPD